MEMPCKVLRTAFLLSILTGTRLTVQSVAAEPPPVSAKMPDIGTALEAIRAAHKLPALGGATVEDGKVTQVAAVGSRKIGEEKPIRADDLWHLGSNTKSMTATMIAALIDDGTLSWNTTVGEIFGDMKDVDPVWKTVTLEQLLSNRSGAPTDISEGGLWMRLYTQRDPSPTEQRRRLVEGVITRPGAAKPGEKFIYSNAGFAIAGAMAEKKTGIAYEQLMQDRLFKPLGITTAGFGPPGTAGKLDQPLGHTAAGAAIEVGALADNPAAIAPAGTCHMSLADWAKFVAFHVGGAANQKLLKPETFNRLHDATPDKQGENYAKGWVIFTRSWAKGAVVEGQPEPVGRTFFHNGSNTMWFAVMWLAPERNLAFIAVTNQGGDEASKACDEAVVAMLKLTEAKVR